VDAMGPPKAKKPNKEILEVSHSFCQIVLPLRLHHCSHQAVLSERVTRSTVCLLSLSLIDTASLSA
jgi:hypothetical protein